MKDRNLFHLVNTIGNIFTRGCTTRKNITDGVYSMEYSIFQRKKQIESIYSKNVFQFFSHGDFVVYNDVSFDYSVL